MLAAVRLFVAVSPPADVVAALRDLPRPASADLRWTTEGQWHVTLRFLGRVDDVDAVVAALGDVAMPAAHVEVGPATTTLGRENLVLRVRGLGDLAAALPFPLDRPFRGHLTVARARRRGTVPRSLTGTPFSATWTATSFSLVRSETKPTGAVYTDVATFPLS